MMLINPFMVAPAIPASTKILMHFDGADGGTVFTDSSQSARSITRTGTVTTSNTQSKFGGTSLKNANEGSLVIPNSADFHLGTADFTIECWVYLLSYNSFNTVLNASNSPSGGAAWRFYASASGIEANRVSFNGGAYSASVPPLTTWVHIAAVRHGGFVKVYLDGVAGTQAAVATSSAPTGDIIIGKVDTFTSNMYIDELRISDYAVYTSNFTPPTSPF